MTDNFVDIVGYQLEKVHTGVISWLLDSHHPPLPTSDRLLLLQRLAHNLPHGDPITEVIPIREYSFGRRLRIDLVVEVRFSTDQPHYVLLECKADSDVSLEQLQRSRDAFLKKTRTNSLSCVVLAIGASQFTYQHFADDVLNLGFQVVDLPRACQVFSGLSIAGKNRLYDDWCDALQREEARARAVDQELASVDKPWNSALEAKGYRLGFPLFYMFYAKLRNELDNGPFQNWAIYSARNNPVMNWSEGWIPSGTGDHSLQLYWEFAWDSFYLKAKLTNESPERWQRVRSEVVRVCSSCPVPGRRTANRKGTGVSAYKWTFDFCRETVAEICRKTNDVLAHVHERLRSIA